MCLFSLTLCMDFTTLCKLKCPVQPRVQLPDMESLKPDRKDAQIQKKTLCKAEMCWFFLIPLCHTLPRKASRSPAQKIPQLDFWAIRTTAHGAASPLHSQLPLVASGLSKWTWLMYKYRYVYCWWHWRMSSMILSSVWNFKWILLHFKW